MATNTSSLTTMTLNQASINKNNGSRGMALRRMLPNLLINAGAPFMINYLAAPHMSSVDALLLASSVPALFTLGSLIWKKRIDAVGLLVVVGLLLSIVFALLFNSQQLLLLQGTAVTGLFGIVMLISLLFPRPVLFYIVRSVMTQNDAQRIASFNADWAFPQFRSCYRLMTSVWGIVTMLHLLLLIVLVFSLPTSLMLMVGPILNFGIIIPVAHWNTIYLRKNQRVFTQLR
jgi:intracellular septation protein A